MKNRFPVSPLASIYSLAACFRLRVHTKQAAIVFTALFLASCTAGHIPSAVNGVNPDLELVVLPDALGFGNVNVGVAKAQTVTLTNAGTTPITISSGQVTGPGFALSGASFPLTLQGKAVAEVSVSFNPSSAGSVTGELVLVSNAYNRSASVSLNGTGVGPSASHAISLAWQSSNSYVVGYNVYRSDVSGGPYSRLNAQPVTCTCYTDSVDQSETFFYVVTSVDSAGDESNYSIETEVNIP